MNATCKHCGAAFQAQRKTAKFCSDRCRIGAHRREPRPMASAWLRKAARALARDVFAPCGIEIDPGQFDVSLGFPVRGARNQVAGATVGDAFIVITPSPDPVFVLETLAHEMVHIVALGDGHGREFRRIAAAAGLLPPWRATRANPALAEKLRAIVMDLGPMPVPAIPAKPAQAAFIADGQGGFIPNPAAALPWVPERRKLRRP